MTNGIYFYVNTAPDDNGYHYLHRQGCKHMPDKKDALFIGTLYTLNQGLTIARMSFKKVKPCIKCCIRHSATRMPANVQPVHHFPR